MKTSYINPELFIIEIDREISLRLATISPLQGVVNEPGSGNAGEGGTTNSSGETGWERAQHSQGINAITPSSQQQQNQPLQTDWQNFKW